ncbi:MAG: hypothetical protein ACJAUV_000272 [Flavobacteriales bacterium]
MKTIDKQNPYMGVVTNPKSLHITFLSDSPSQEKIKALLAKITLPDQFAILNNAAYVVCEQG